MSENTRKYINEESTYLRTRIFSKILQLYESNPDQLSDFPESATEFCKENNIEVKDEEDASEKATSYAVKNIEELIRLATKIIRIQHIKELTPNSIKSFCDRISFDPTPIQNLENDIDQKLSNMTPHMLFDAYYRFKKDAYYCDPVTLDTHHSPVYLDTTAPIITKSSRDAQHMDNRMKIELQLIQDKLHGQP